MTPLNDPIRVTKKLKFVLTIDVVCNLKRKQRYKIYKKLQSARSNYNSTTKLALLIILTAGLIDLHIGNKGALNMNKLYKAIALSLGALATVSVSQASDFKYKLKQQQNTPKIIGGVLTPVGERAFSASLQGNGQHFCGGSVIGKRWILTAAHCVEGVTDANASELAVRVNFNDLTNDTQGEQHTVAKVFSHPDYAAGQAADVALLYLATEVSGSVPVIPLADSQILAASGTPGAIATVSGWGNTSTTGEEYPNEMFKVDVPLVSSEVCNSADAYNGGVNATTEICAGFAEGGKDSCQGDSGGPLTIMHDGRETQIGVVSWGDGCAAPNKYGVYANMATFKSWADGIMSGNVIDVPTNPDQPGDGPSTPADGELTSGQLVQGLVGSTDSETHFTIDVPKGAKILWVDIKGDNGDADLYIRRNEIPTTDDYDYSPYLEGSSESVLVRKPRQGTYHIMIHGYENYDDLEIMAFFR